MKKKTIITAIISFALGALIYNMLLPLLFQEQNTWVLIRGVSKLTFGKNNMVALSDSNNKYLTASKYGFETVDSFLKNKGYKFTEQMGSGYFYQSTDKTAALTRRQYSRFYIIWTITENQKKSIAEELKECMPRSDMGGYIKCQELFKQITDFNSCVSAGFSIMKSNPSQCAVPDGRVFVEN